jgi:hypothetical protein
MKRASLGLVFAALLIGAPVSTTFAADMALKAPPPAPAPVDTFTGPEVGISLLETARARDCINSNDIVNGVCFSKDPVGAAFNVGYGFRPWANNWIVTPFAEVDVPNITNNYYLPGFPGAYLGTKSNYDVLGGLKVGPTVAPNLWIYGIGAVGFQDEKMTVTFFNAVPTSSASATVFGGAVGAGIAWEPFSAPVSISFEYRHEWWNTATYNNPPASPGFYYGFREQDNTWQLGLNWYFAGK